MLIRNWMTKEVITVSPETSMLKASKLMKEHDIKRLPVIDTENHVVGIVSDRDIKAASPSKATTLDMHELYYLLSELKIKSIMTPNPTTVSPTDTVESVAMLMEEHGFGGIPVVDDEGKLVGIISDHDIFKVLISITGVRQGGVQLAFNVADQSGSMRPILDALRDNHASIISILSSNDATEVGTRHVFIRLRPMEIDAEDALIQILKDKFSLLYWARNAVHLTDKN